MTTTQHSYVEQPATGSTNLQSASYKFALILIGVAFCIDLLTPFLISNSILPGAVRWLSDLLLLSIIGVALFQMLLQDRIPGAVLLIAAITIVGCVVSIYSDQVWLATAWGWWRLFKFPIAAIFVYIQPYWPVHYAERLLHICVGILTINTFLQILLYLSGEIPGDHLSGTFGRFGVAPLFFFLCFVIALAFGRWLVYGDWKTLIWVVSLGMVSSLLGEMKAFTIVVSIFAAFTFVIHAVRGGQIRQLILYVSLFIFGALVFTVLYNNLVADPRGTRRIQEYLNSDTTSTYLGNIKYDSSTGGYELGRNASVVIAWNTVRSDYTTRLFGMGIGSRSESRSLAIRGVGVQQSYYGAANVPTLGVFMHELGLVGLLIFGLLILWIQARLVSYLGVCQEESVRTIIYGLIIFSITWPFWIWYTQVWIHSVGMLLYWCTLAYIMNITLRCRVGIQLESDRTAVSNTLASEL